jgi:Na+/proline symporter/signal transduction histidine kinase/ActR/RegA family two-component response regulator
MLPGWAVIAVALGYIGLLFVIASYGDRPQQIERQTRSRLLIYPLSLAIYCTSWTFFGSVGLASRTGYDFLTIYIGPMLVIGLCTPVIVRIVRLAKAQNITSIADFIAARYGKDQGVAALVATIAIIGTIPYIALQLKAVSSSLGTILAHSSVDSTMLQAAPGDIALLVTLSMAAFAVLFGTRHIDTTEHQHGLMLAIAAESIVKLVAFLAVGIFVTFWMFDGPISMFTQALEMPATTAMLHGQSSIGTLLAMTLLSTFAIVLLPRQFHVTVVENNNEAEISRAAWLFPIYLVLINLFVLPIAVAGVLIFPPGKMDSDMFVLTLPLTAGSDVVTLVAFVGGLSAATARVIVESVALSIMVSNDIVIPWVLKRKESLFAGRENMGAMLLMVRRAAIFVILFLAYIYYRTAGEAQLASIGLLSFAAIAQLAPAFFGGMIWRRATARGAVAGLSIGTLTWAYTLLLPSFAELGLIGHQLLSEGPGGIFLLRPQALLGVDLPPLLHGVLWSLSLNVLAYVAFSFTRVPASVERLQANLFAPLPNYPIAPSYRRWRSPVRVNELTKAVARYLGEERTQAAFKSFAGSRRIDLEPDAEADFQLLRYAEHLLASAIGAASSRLVLTILLRKRALSTSRALKLLDDANAAIHYNREILQTALDHVRQGIAVFDKELGLTCWNRYFGEILDLPADMTQSGVALEEILRVSAEQQGNGLRPSEHDLHERYLRYLSGDPFLERFAERGLVIEVRSNRMPDGGMVITFSDMTPSVEAAEALERVNETLERRVRERTEELTRLNAELARAKGEAEEANISKTRFLAAASHDILQPLNAARLYVTSLVEREESGADARLVSNIDASLEAVEEILGALLDISRLDTGALKPEIGSFRIDELLSQIEVEFAPLAREKGLELVFVPSSLTVRSDRRLLRRLVQNLISNAIKYTLDGRVLVGCRRRRGRLRIDVWDTGIGIPPSKKREIFKEFHRLDEGARAAPGLGLGLSIVERIARMLDHKIDLWSTLGGGSRFSVEVPLAPALARRAAPVAVARSDSRQLSGSVVLCLDNDLRILDGMRTLLEGWGCRVLPAPSLAEAIATAAEAKIPLDCLLVDYRLDDGNGLDAIVELRGHFGAHLPAILITADRSLHLRRDAQKRDIQFLNKPVKPASLRALLAQYRLRRIAAAE